MAAESEPGHRERAPSRASILTLAALLCGVWGSTWLAIKIGLRDLPVLTAAGLRFVVAGAVMAVLALVIGRRGGLERPTAKLVLYQATFQFAVNYGLVYFAESELPSGLVSVLWSVYPLLLSLTEHFVHKSSRLGPRQWLGLVVAFAGVVFLFATDVARVSARAIPMALLLLLAPAGVVVATLALKREGARTSTLLLSRDSMLLGGAALVVLALIFERAAPVKWTPLALGTLAYLALFGSVLTFGVYFWLLRFVPAYRLSLISYVTPVVALVLGALAGGEPLSVTTVAGSALVLSGVALVMLARARETTQLAAGPRASR